MKCKCKCDEKYFKAYDSIPALQGCKSRGDGDTSLPIFEPHPPNNLPQNPNFLSSFRQKVSLHTHTLSI